HVRTDCRNAIEMLEFGQIIEVAARHAVCAQNKLREKRHVEAREDKEERNRSKKVVGHFAEHFREPIIDSAHDRHQCSADHYIVKVRDNKIGIVEVDVDADNG